MWNINIYSFVLLFNALLSILLNIYVVLKKKIKGKIYFILVMISIFIWSLTDSLGLASSDLGMKIFFAKMAYIGIVSISPMIFLFFYNYLQSENKLNFSSYIALWIVPVTVFVLALTNECHLLIWPSIALVSRTNGIFAIYEHGIGVYGHMLFSYSLILYVLYMLLKIAYRHKQVYRKQAIIMIVAMLVPFLGNFLYIFKINPLTFIDLTPYLFTISCFMITWGFTSYRFLDTKPIAYSKLYLNMSDSVLVLDDYLMIADVNPSFEELFGLNDLIGKNAVDTFKTYSEFKKIFDNKTENKYEIPVCISGKNIWLDVQTSPLFDMYKDMIGMLIVMRDITDRKNAENIIKESEKNLKEIVATKDKFFSIIAHDLKSPFSALLGLSEILKDDIDTLTDDQKKDFADIIYKAAKTTYEMIKNLLEWSRIQTGKFIIEKEELDISKISSEVCDTLMVNALNKEIVIKNEILNDTMIFSDRNMLKLLFHNLITNAIKFSHRGGAIIIGVKTEKDFLNVFVCDSGIGIRKEDIYKLFRTDISFSIAGTEEEEGTGLGLILCKEMIEKIGGKIRVESEIGKGSTFIFSIPKVST
jgi:PAS domain S-box-containing protein